MSRPLVITEGGIAQVSAHYRRPVAEARAVFAESGWTILSPPADLDPFAGVAGDPRGTHDGPASYAAAGAQR